MINTSKPLNVHLYWDLDGVLADFESRAREILKHARRPLSSKDWTVLLSTKDFFYGMRPYVETCDLFHKYQKLAATVTIVTALPYSAKESASEQKLHWCEDNLMGQPWSDYKFVACMRADKPKHLRKDPVSGHLLPGIHLLIDDRLENCEAWRASHIRCKAVHHHNAGMTGVLLRNIFGEPK